MVFERLQHLGKDKFTRICNELARGTPALLLARPIQREWGDARNVSEHTLAKHNCSDSVPPSPLPRSGAIWRSWPERTRGQNQAAPRIFARLLGRAGEDLPDYDPLPADPDETSVTFLTKRSGI